MLPETDLYSKAKLLERRTFEAEQWLELQHLLKKIWQNIKHPTIIFPVIKTQKKME